MGGRNPRSSKKELIVHLDLFKLMNLNDLVRQARRAAKRMYDGPIDRLDFNIHALLLDMADTLEKLAKRRDKDELD